MKQIIVFLSAMVFTLAMFTSCQKDDMNEEVKSTAFLYQLFTDLQIEDLEALGLDPEQVKPIANRLWDLKAQHNLNLERIHSVGDPANDQNLLAALMVVETFEKEAVVAKLETAGEAETAEERGFNVYHWTNGASRFSWWCFCRKYPTYKKSHGTILCNGQSLNNRIYYKKCRQIECNIPSACN